MTTYPFHYRDNGAPCEHSGQLRSDDSEPCPNGCDGAKTYYANDGHEECADE